MILGREGGLLSTLVEIDVEVVNGLVQGLFEVGVGYVVVSDRYVVQSIERVLLLVDVQSQLEFVLFGGQWVGMNHLGSVVFLLLLGPLPPPLAPVLLHHVLHDHLGYLVGQSLSRAVLHHTVELHVHLLYLRGAERLLQNRRFASDVILDHVVVILE